MAVFLEIKSGISVLMVSMCVSLCVCLLRAASQLTVVMDRILAFSLASPLAKFLNGLEILLSKAQVSSPAVGEP